jgi:hypothetical protein
MIPKIVHFTIPKNISEIQTVAIAKARSLLEGWEIKVWQDPIDPSQFSLSSLWPQCNSGAQLADLVRIEAVYKFGGIYLDSDIILELPLDPLLKCGDFFVCTEDGNLATNAVFGATAGHPLLARMIESISSDGMDWSIPPNQTTGPAFFSKVLADESESVVLPRQTFYPYNWNEDPCASHPATYGVHVWAGSWKDQGPVSKVKSALRRLSPKKALTDLRGAIGEKLATSPTVLRRRALQECVISIDGCAIRRSIHGKVIALPVREVPSAALIAIEGFRNLGCEIFLRHQLNGGDYFVEYSDGASVFALVAAGEIGAFGRAFVFPSCLVAADALRYSIKANGYGNQVKILPPIDGDGALVPPPLDALFPADIPINTVVADINRAEAAISGAQRLLTARAIDRVLLPDFNSGVRYSHPILMDRLEETISYGYAPHAITPNGQLKPLNLGAFSLDNVKTIDLVLERS